MTFSCSSANTSFACVKIEGRPIIAFSLTKTCASIILFTNAEFVPKAEALGFNVRMEFQVREIDQRWDDLVRGITHDDLAPLPRKRESHVVSHQENRLRALVPFGSAVRLTVQNVLDLVQQVLEQGARSVPVILSANTGHGGIRSFGQFAQRCKSKC